MAAPSPMKKGLTTIVWGTASTLGTPSAAVVNSINVTPVNDGPVGVIENGDGARIAKIYLDDGFTADVECLYDTALTWPAVGDTVVLTLPKVGAAGGSKDYNCTLESYSPKKERKKETLITMKLSYNEGVVANS